jgi:peptidoglycan/LPS O-acetylase OafA/YrhL
MTLRPHARWLLPWVILATFELTMRSRLVRAFFANPVVSTVGGMCYTIYLYHWYLMKYLVIWLGGFRLDSYLANLVFYGAVSGAWVVLAGAVLFVLFERPFMGIRLKRGHSTHSA